MREELKAQGFKVSRKRVACLMGEAGLVGVSRRRLKGTTKRDPDAKPAPDLVDRKFANEGADRLWVTDIKYIPMHEGLLHLATVMDSFSRWIVGWAGVVQKRGTSGGCGSKGCGFRVLEGFAQPRIVS